MKLVFRKYMEFESAMGNENKLADLRNRVEQYLEKTFKADNQDGSSDAEPTKKDVEMVSDDEEEDSNEEATPSEEADFDE